ncbi:MAG: hypothetical protein ABI150_10375 [Nitrobacter sp.]|jgi:hypothetical protein
MRQLAAVFVAAILIGDPMLTARADNGCIMTASFDDPYPVMVDQSKSLFWVRPMEVDADGARNAYHRDDPHGNKGLAIEYMGNGMTIRRDGKPLEFVAEEANNAEWLNAYRLIVDNGWKAPAGWEIDIYGLARDKNDNVCIMKDGRLVSPTSLVQNPMARSCDPKRYIDALQLPGIVVPNRNNETEKPARGVDQEVAPPFASRGVYRGDLAVAYNPETKIWKGAFIYDTGPRDLLGEGSLRLVLDLRDDHSVPTSGLQTNSLGIEETHVVVFPGTAKLIGHGRTWSRAKIQRLAEQQFKRWGGGTIAGALEKLASCAAEYKTRFR